ncbi:MAG: radical SAM protein [bacterium]
MKRKLRVALVELYATQGGSLWAPRMRDLYSLFKLPSRAIDLLAAILERTGLAAVEAFNPLYGSPGKRIRAEDLRRLAAMDVVGISSITRTQPPSYQLAARLRELNPKIWILFGGPHVTALPEEALQHGDVVIRHEGDATIAELAMRFAEDLEAPVLEDVPGISFRDRRDGALHSNPDRPFLTDEELSDLPFPVFPPEVLKGIGNSVIISSRGCPFDCEFCAVITHFGARYRAMDAERTVELIEHTVRQTRKPIFFGDDNFHANPARTRQILEKVLSRGISMPPWGAQVRVEAARDTEALALMKRAGCQRVYVGFESINEETLKLFNKRSTREKNELAIRGFHQAGLAVHGMFVLGSDADTVDTVRETVRFAKRMMLDTAQFFCLTPLPGTPLSQRYGREGKVLSRHWHLYDAHHVTVRPERIAPHVLQDELIRGHMDYYSFREAGRFLMFSRTARVYNAGIRLAGKLLAARIGKQMQPYRDRLMALDHWSQELETRHRTLRDHLTNRIQELGKGLSQSTESLRASGEDFVRWLRESAASAPKEFFAYCQRQAARHLEKAQSLVVSPGVATSDHRALGKLPPGR